MFSVLLCLDLWESTAASVSLLAAGAAALLISLFIKRIRQTLIIPTVFSGVIAACLLFTAFQSDYNKTVSFVGENMSVSGVVTQAPEFSRENCRYYCVIKADEVGGNKVKTKLRLSFSESYDGIDPSDIVIGDRVTFSGTVHVAGAASESSRHYYKSHRIYLGAYSAENLIIEKPEIRPVSYYIDVLRCKISSNLMHDFDNENASLLVSLLTGNKDYMDDETYDKFIGAGIVHIMAVSGLHLSVWVAFLSLFMDFSGKKGKLMAVVMIAFTVFMMNFASFTGSVKRASAMTILYFIAKISGRKTDALNSLGFAAVCALLFNPFGALDVSFLLSFLSTMGIILMGVPLSERIMAKLHIENEGIRKAASLPVTAAALSVSVTFFVFPVSVLMLGGVSFAAPLSNLLICLAAPFLLLLTGFYSFLHFVPVISTFVAVIMKYLSSYIIDMAGLISDLPFAYVNTGFENLRLWFITAFGLLLISMLLYNFDRVLMKAVAIISAGVFLLSFSVNFYTSLDKCRITLYGDGKGDCAVVSLNGKAVLIGFDGDSYDEREILEDTITDRTEIEAAFFTEDFISEDKRSLCEALGTEYILTHDGENAVLFDKVKIIKEGKNITVDATEVKTEIFLKEYLQDEDKYDTIAYNDGKFVFTLRKSSPYTVTVLASGGEKVG